MSKPINLFWVALFIATISFAQATQSFGNLTQEEINFKENPADGDSHAVVLYEKGDNYFDIVTNRILLIKEYHVKIKILDKDGFDEGNIEIPYYRGNGDSEKVEQIRAITHNDGKKISLMPDKVYTNNINERWSAKVFTFSDIQEGSVLEYSYKIVSPYIYNFNGWRFQSTLPKRYSEFNAKIPGNYRYNRTLKGSLPLEVNEAKLLRECFRIPGAVKAADCEVLKYVMKDIPAFREEEYMLASSNYLSQIEFELAEYYRLDGVTERFTKTWDDADKEFRNNRDIGRQLTKKGYFEKQVPESLMDEADPLTRAKNIYNFVRDHYTWNGKYGIYDNVRVKEAFDERKGNIGEINISLINLLNVGGIKTDLMLISTRNNGLPKKTHPVMSDFNYLIAKAEIGGDTYLLDASDNFTPFGMLPFRCLNYYGRVMDFKNASSWYPINADESSKYAIRAQISFDLETNKAEGIMDEILTGYEAINRKIIHSELNEAEYMNKLENKVSGFLVTDFQRMDNSDPEKTVTERVSFELQNVFQTGNIYLNPIFVKFFESNPFLAEDRQFPVDFGYERQFTYTVSILIPEGYTIENLPVANRISLPNNKGIFEYQATVSHGNISIRYNLNLNSTLYSASEYDILKTFFAKAIDIQNNSLIVLKKQT